MGQALHHLPGEDGTGTAVTALRSVQEERPASEGGPYAFKGRFLLNYLSVHSLFH